MSRVLAVAGRELIIREDHRLDSEAGCVVWDAGLCLVYYLDHAGAWGNAGSGRHRSSPFDQLWQHPLIVRCSVPRGWQARD